MCRLYLELDLNKLKKSFVRQLEIWTLISSLCYFRVIGSLGWTDNNIEVTGFFLKKSLQ